uniref:Uncharacterized protein n=1 Tax=Ralstonia pickettii (strain 12D) TaxID=428406 RepID=C6BL18_RALP1
MQAQSNFPALASRRAGLVNSSSGDDEQQLNGLSGMLVRKIVARM